VKVKSCGLALLRALEENFPYTIGAFAKPGGTRFRAWLRPTRDVPKHGAFETPRARPTQWPSSAPPVVTTLGDIALSVPLGMHPSSFSKFAHDAELHFLAGRDDYGLTGELHHQVSPQRCGEERLSHHVRHVT
jgi:hypothetical protein